MEEITAKDIVMNVNDAAKHRGITAREIAAYLGITASAWSVYKRKPDILQIGRLIQVAEYMGVSLSELLKKPL